MKKTILFIIVLLLFGPPETIAADNAIPASGVSEYSVEIKKVELCDSALTSCFTLFVGNSGFIDIASQNAGTDVANLTSGQVPTPGTYTIIRTTVSNNFRIKAQFASGGATFFTNAATNFGGLSVHTVANTNTSGANGVTTIIEFGPTGLNLTLYTNQTANGSYRNAAGDLIHIMNPSTSITVTQLADGTRISNVTTVIISFDVNNVLVFNDDNAAARFFRPGTPGVTVTVQ